MTRLHAILAGGATLALLAGPAAAADDKAVNKVPDAASTSTGSDANKAGSSDGASTGTSSSGNMQDSGVGEPKPDAASKNTNSDGSPGKNTSGPDTGPRN
jgi:hypothetical protein